MLKGFETLFADDAIAAETRALNEAVKLMTANLPAWWEIGAPQMREMRMRGEGPFPAVEHSKLARTIEIEGFGGRKIALHIVAPENPKGVFLHFHGGGWVLGSADQTDRLLERFALEAGLACVSVEYRLAPEDPYPAGPDDCEAAAVWTIEHAKSEFGTDRLTLGGESAGAHLSAVTLLRLRDRHGYTDFRAANLVFGAYDLSMTPSQRRFGDERLILRTMDLEKFAGAFIPPGIDKRDPDVSPIYASLEKMPPALFTIGTRDALVDDSLFMYSRWIAAGNRAELAVYPGGIHGFIAFPIAIAQTALDRMIAFLAAAVD